jgi:HprK-related kinase B
MQHTLESAAQALINGAELCSEQLHLDLGECSLRLRSNSPQLIIGLRDYFGHVLAAQDNDTPDLDVIAIDREAPDIGLAFVDWKREPGKSGRKDAYADLPGGRAVLKVRTGMVFLQSPSQRIAAGPCVQYDNQVINFINAQYMTWLQHHDWLICHASGLVMNGKALAIAGFSGGGKSTLMLKLLDHDEIGYLTNDRLFIRANGSGTNALGIPKLPRINPGTIVHNPKLHGLISAEKRQQLLRLPTARLWEIEDKYDVHMERIYGAGRIVPRAPLHAFLVLNWQRDSSAPLKIKQVDLAERRNLLAAIMKSPGPFHQYPNGDFHPDDAEFDQDAYLDALLGVAVYEASGGVDFPRLTDYCLERLMP